MRINIIAFALGVCLLQQQARLPPGWELAIVAALALLLFFSGQWLETRARRPFSAIACLLAGFAWAAAYGHWQLADRLDSALEGRELVVSGVVASLPQPDERGVRFDFAVDTAPAGVPSRLALAWYNGLAPEEFQLVQPLAAGERWRLLVRLKRPHGTANAHNLDVEAAMLERGIGATGTVRAGESNQRIDALALTPVALLQHVRERMRGHFWDALPAHRYDGVLLALAIGEQRAIASADWQLFARTGVSHLMSISGLHVTMLAGLAAWFGSFVWRRSSRLMIALPAQKFAALAGFCAALLYCMVSGFAVPAQRTLYMVGMVALALWLGRTQSATRVLALALLLVLLLDPLAVLAAGFWLSFGAVAVILYVGLARTGRPHWLLQWGRVQWAVTVGLAPLLLVLFGQVSIVSPVANAAAIPVVSLLVTPLALAGAVLPDWFGGGALLRFAHWLFEGLMWLLRLLSENGLAVWQQARPTPALALLALAGVAWLLAPAGFPARYAGLALLAPVFFVRPAAPAQGALWLTVLDVGQGLAVVARTAGHTLLYDAGPQFGPESDSGGRTILPWLRGEGITALDAMVISHQDNDHAGGAVSVATGLPVGRIYSSLATSHAVMAPIPYRLPCHAGQGWEWDGVRFEMLHPATADYAAWLPAANAMSCVLRIEAAGRVVLITGDIERASEAALLARSTGALRADILLVPHHGSRTSSTAQFIAAVQPAHAVFTPGYRNRFGHPRADVVARYRDSGATLYRSDQDGAVDFRIDAEGLAASRWRSEHPRYWRD
jgi:competence protein ComEC